MSDKETNLGLEPRVAQLERDTTKIMNMLERLSTVTTDLANGYQNIQKELKESRQHQELMFDKVHDRLTEGEVARSSQHGSSIQAMVDTVIGGFKLFATVIVIVGGLAGAILYLADNQTSQGNANVRADAQKMVDEHYSDLRTRIDQETVIATINRTRIENIEANLEHQINTNAVQVGEIIELQSKLESTQKDTESIEHKMDEYGTRLRLLESGLPK